MAARLQLGTVRLTLDALGVALKLPPDHRVIHVLPADWEDLATTSLRFVVEGPTMPAVLEGGVPPLVALPKA